MRLFLVVASLLSFALCFAARGEERIALVVANPSFENGPAMVSAQASADLVAESLRGLNFNVAVVADGDRATVARAMFDFAKALDRPDAIGVFYYVGQAARVNDVSHLLTRDTRIASPADIAATALPLNLFLMAVDATSSFKLVLLDITGTALALPAGVEPGLTPIEPMLNIVVSLSAMPGKVALDGSGPTSAYAEALARRLARPGVDIEMALAGVRDDVAAATGGMQVPLIVSSLAGGPRFVPLPTTGNPPPTTANPPEAPAKPEPSLGESGPVDGYHIPDPYQWGRSLNESAGGGGFTGMEPSAEEEAAAYEEYRRVEEERLMAEEARRYEEARQAEKQRMEEGAKAQQPEGQPAPPPIPSMEGPAAPAMTAESMWNEIRNTRDPNLLVSYIAAFPDSPFKERAMQRYGKLMYALSRDPSGNTPIEDEPAVPELLPAAPETVDVIRHPTIDAPDVVAAGQTVTVSVALTEQKLTPEAQPAPAPTTSLTPEGALVLDMPAGAEQWSLDIDLFASGFDIADGGGWSRKATLYSVGDSDFVRFELKARPIAVDSKTGQFIARIYSNGRFLGSASRRVIVGQPQTAEGGGMPVSAPSMMRSAGIAPTLAGSVIMDVSLAAEVPDLDVTILYDDPNGLGEAQIIIHSPHLAGPVTDNFSTPPEMAAWLDSEYRRLLKLALQVRGAVPLQPSAAAPDTGGGERFAMLAAEGFGDTLYRDYVPNAFKEVFWALKERGVLRSIQITSNSPVMPWELVRPRSRDGATGDDFLGIGYRLARWAPRSFAAQADNPLNRLPFTGVATVAPAYADSRALPFQKIELDALSKLAGFRQFDGDFVSFEKLVGEVSSGFIHFSGHGAVNAPGSGAPVFAIELADQSLDPGTWSALIARAHGTGNPFYFFNACDTGRSELLGGFIQGWGPAVLASGASGFIGGMWPLTDRTAASFSTSFYSGIADNLKDGPVYLADVLRDVRRQFYETGDPTYLAYTFYGNANLQVVAQ